MFGIRRSAFTVLSGLFILVPVLAYGGLVKGKVTGVSANTSFSIKNSNGEVIKKSVSIDAQSNFAVTLRPGVYTAVSGQLSATIRSSKQPLSGQVLNFKLKPQP